MSNLRPDILRLPPIVRRPSNSDGPLVSIITPNFNHAHYLEDTLIGVNRQTYQNLEHIVIDGGSSDGTIAILHEYPEVIWKSELDKGVLEAFLKGLRISKGEYILTCFSSDMFIDPNWVQNCVDIMETDSKVSMIWGGLATANIRGEIVEEHSWPKPNRDIPNDKDMFFYWLATSVNLPETNYCIRKDVLETCLSEVDIPDNEYESNEDINLLLQFRFHSQGYLSQYLPKTANFVRVHSDQRTLAWQTSGLFNLKMATYGAQHKEYRKQLLMGRKHHQFKGSDGGILETVGWFKIIYSTIFQKLRILLKGQI